MNRRASAFVDYTRAGPLMYIVAIAELDERGQPYHVVHVAKHALKKDAESHVKKLKAALNFRPKTKAKAT